jgi:hypothetical protein
MALSKTSLKVEGTRNWRQKALGKENRLELSFIGNLPDPSSGQQLLDGHLWEVTGGQKHWLSEE